MTSGSKRALIAIFIAFIIGIVIGSIPTARHFRHSCSSVKCDTVYVDRLIEMPAPSNSEIIPSETYAQIPIDDIDFSSDTTQISIRKDSVIFRGIEPVSGASYEAIVTGIQPNLDKLHFVIPERIITKMVPKPLSGWSIGLFGDGIYCNNQLGAKLGAYTSYTSGPFSVHLDIGAQYTGMPQNKTIYPYIGLGVRIDIFRP